MCHGQLVTLCMFKCYTSQQVNPISLMDKMSKIVNAVTILKKEFEQLVADRIQLTQQFGQQAADFEERLSSTLDYLVAKK